GRRELLDEIRLIGTRLGIEGPATIPLDSFLKANPDTEYGKAVRQYCSRPRRNPRKSHSGPTGGGKAMATYIRAVFREVATALAALTSGDHPLAASLHNGGQKERPGFSTF